MRADLDRHRAVQSRSGTAYLPLVWTSPAPLRRRARDPGTAGGRFTQTTRSVLWLFPDADARPHACAAWYGLFAEQYVSGAQATPVVREGGVGRWLWRCGGYLTTGPCRRTECPASPG